MQQNLPHTFSVGTCMKGSQREQEKNVGNSLEIKMEDSQIENITRVQQSYVSCCTANNEHLPFNYFLQKQQNYDIFSHTEEICRNIQNRKV